MRTLNLGILAHVDAGKTSLTERLLYDVGVIDHVGRVDDGSTHTDSLELERARGITIRSAVVSFPLGDVTVNLIDTPGHPDFIAEVERVLDVLDGVVLVVSAVEGVQSQTRILMRTLRRLRIPTLIFVNKIDRSGAQGDQLVRDLADKLIPSAVAMGDATRLGSRAAGFAPYDADSPGFTDALVDVLARHDDGLLASYVGGAVLPYDRLRRELAAQTGRALVHPVYFGSAVTGAGLDALSGGIRELLPGADGDPEGPLLGRVFKIERGTAGEKIAYVRLFSGLIRVRERLSLGADRDGKVTAVRVFDHGSTRQTPTVAAREIGQLWGLGAVRVGDRIGAADGISSAADGAGHFAPPTLETVVVPVDAADRGTLHAALTQLAEQDPLIDVRLDERRRDATISLYGEVQKEIIQATLRSDYGLEVDFRESTTICVERPSGTGEAVEILNAAGNPFRATVGLRIEPAPAGTGIEFRLRVSARSVPLYVYRSTDHFAALMRRYVEDTLREGRYGWQVTDCLVTMVDCAYSSPDGPPSTRGPLSTLSDYRDLTPMVAMAALERAGSTVCEPMHRFRLELPGDTLGVVLPALARLSVVPEAPTTQGPTCVVEGEIPAAQVNRLRQRLPALTHGEGALESEFHRHQPVRGAVPSRSRTRPDPLVRKEYLRHVQRRTQ